MDNIPKRTNLAGLYRKPLAWLETKISLSFLNPNYLQIIALILSFIYLFIDNNVTRLIIVTVVLISDWLDGATARSQKITSKEGWMIDVAVDRISEGFIFAIHLDTYVGKVFFGLYVLNTILSMYSISSKKHLILPLRFMWLIYLAGLIIWN